MKTTRIVKNIFMVIIAITAIIVARYTLDNEACIQLKMPDIKIPFISEISGQDNINAYAATYSMKTMVLESTDVNAFLNTEGKFGNTKEAAGIGRKLYEKYSSTDEPVPFVYRVIAIDDLNCDNNGHRGFHIYIASNTYYDKYRIDEHNEMYNILQDLHKEYPSGYHRVQWQDTKYTHEMMIDANGHVADCNCPPDLYLYS